MLNLQIIIENHWYKKNNLILSVVLYPFSLIFLAITSIRKLLFKLNIIKSYKLPVPVVIIGNITVGGAGKTPLTLKIADELTKSGYKVGIILRGYKSQINEATVVTDQHTVIEVGDEAMIYKNNNQRVAIGSNRYLAGITLLKEYPDTQIILSDDGLQHYRLKRDYEIAVIDSTRLLGNQHVLPMGPLREKKKRLKSVDAIIYNGEINNKLTKPQKNQLILRQHTVIDKIINYKTNQIINITELNQKSKIHAIAAIGNPQRFFEFIKSQQIQITSYQPLPDHYDFKDYILPKEYDAILVTEKDYVKLANQDNGIIWTIKIRVDLSTSDLMTNIIKLI